MAASVAKNLKIVTVNDRFCLSDEFYGFFKIFTGNFKRLLCFQNFKLQNTVKFLIGTETFFHSKELLDGFQREKLGKIWINTDFSPPPSFIWLNFSLFFFCAFNNLHQKKPLTNYHFFYLHFFTFVYWIFSLRLLEVSHQMQIFCHFFYQREFSEFPFHSCALQQCVRREFSGKFGRKIGKSQRDYVKSEIIGENFAKSLKFS